MVIPVFKIFISYFISAIRFQLNHSKMKLSNVTLSTPMVLQITQLKLNRILLQQTKEKKGNSIEITEKQQQEETLDITIHRKLKNI